MKWYSLLTAFFVVSSCVISTGESQNRALGATLVAATVGFLVGLAAGSNRGGGGGGNRGNGRRRGSGGRNRGGGRGGVRRLINQIFRSRRQVIDMPEDDDQDDAMTEAQETWFLKASLEDADDCLKRYTCEVAAAFDADLELNPIEEVIRKTFAKTLEEIDLGSNAVEFDLASAMGLPLEVPSAAVCTADASLTLRTSTTSLGSKQSSCT